MFCTACGTRNIETSNYCKQCGHKLDHVTAPKISEEAFDRALPLDEQVTALMERAYRLRKTGELASAVRLCEEALQLNPGSTSVHSLLGQIHEQMGNRDAAIHEYERVLQLNPGSIADRVKLDELRGETLPAPLHPRTPPHIVMGSQSLSNPNGRQLLGIAGIAGVLMLLGGLIALQYNASHAPKENTNAQIASGASRLTGSNAAQSPAVSASNGAPVNPGGAANPGATMAANTGITPVVTSTPYVGQAPQPPSYPRERVVYVQSAPAPSPVRNGGLPNLKYQKNTPNENDSPDVHLPDDNGDGAHLSINIPDKGAQANNGSVAQGPKGGDKAGSNGASRPTPAIPPTIEIHPHANDGGGGSAQPDTNAQSHLAIASLKLKSGDYEGAIRAFSAALPGAGTQKAYIYQQMGTCYQHIKNKASAITNFNNAIEEYKKLEQANQQVDLAHAGIKVCENGIKLCNAE